METIGRRHRHVPARSATKNMWGSNGSKIFGCQNIRRARYYGLLVALILAILTCFHLLASRSRRGLGLSALRDNFTAAKSLGVDAGAIKWFVFLISALGTGLTGGLIYMQKARISPMPHSAYWIGPLCDFHCCDRRHGTIEGPIIGVIVFFLLQNMLADYGSWYLLILGVIGIAIMLFAPKDSGAFFQRTGIQIFPVQRRLVNKNQNSEDTNNG